MINVLHWFLSVIILVGVGLIMALAVLLGVISLDEADYIMKNVGNVLFH